MTLRLLLGRAGSGKSTYINNEISRLVETEPTGRPLWLLVPEQATSQAERALATTSPVPGLLRARVVSFQRLAYLLLHEVSGAALVQVGELGRRMMIRKSIEENRAELRTFARAASQPGFTNKLAGIISELKSYRVTPDDLAVVLAEQGDSLPATLYNKLHDLALLYGQLVTEYGDTYLDAEDCLSLLVENLPHSPSLRDTHIWLDGFTGFTTQELDVIGGLLQVCSQVTVSLTLPPELLNQRLKHNHPFFTPWETANLLRTLANELEVDIDTPVDLTTRPIRYQENPALEYLEETYFDRVSEPYKNPTAGLALVSASNRRAEVEAAAREILRLCRAEGYRFRDISVSLRDFNDYDYLLTTVFTDYGIPHFLDKKRSVQHHPALELLRSALECALDNFPYEPVFRCLKTDLFPATREQIDSLENYVLAVGIRGSRWFEQPDWQVHRQFDYGEDFGETREQAEQMAAINRTRRQVARPLQDFSEGLRAASTVQEYALALYQLLADLNVGEQLMDWAEQAAAQGDLETAGLHPQIWESIVRLLDEVVAALGSENLPLLDFARIIESGLEGIELGLIPPELDQVVITSLGRSRNPEVKAALVLGVSEGIFPARVPADGLLTDYEREILAGYNLRLGPSSDRRLFEEQFLIYTALTRASQRLWVSYPLANEEGAALMPSPVIRRLQTMFPRLKAAYLPLVPEGDSAEALAYLAHPSRALMYLAVQLREAQAGSRIPPVWWDVYGYLLSEHPASLLKVLHSLKRRNREEPLPRELSRRLYGKVLRGSVTRLERFNACPFAYFSTYGLRLRERQIYQLAAPDLGSFFHAAMDRFVEQLKDKGLDWGALSPAECADLTEQVVADLTPRLQNHILDSSARFRHVARKLQQTVERSARILGTHARRGRFQPLAVELSFGSTGRLPALRLELSDGTMIELAGRIDRLDVADGPTGSYLRVVDYKSGSSKLTPLEVYYGLKLQLLTYLHVAHLWAQELGVEGARAAGALYFRIYNPLVSTEAPVTEEVAEDLIAKEYKMSGLLLGEREAIDLMDSTITSTSTLIPVTLNKDGSPRKTASHIWSAEQLEQMRQRLTQLLHEAGERIIGGEIGLTPYRLDKETACRFCAYHALCQFDAYLPENKYQLLPKLKPEDVWQKLTEEIGGDEA